MMPQNNPPPPGTENAAKTVKRLAHLSQAPLLLGVIRRLLPPLLSILTTSIERRDVYKCIRPRWPGSR